MNAALIPGDVQRHATSKDTLHQQFAEQMDLSSTDNNTCPHRPYTFRHKTDSSQDSRIDDIIVSQRLCNDTKPTTSILHSFGDSDHDPMLAKISLASIRFVKPGPQHPPLPREARLKTPVPQADLDAFKHEFEQETPVETAKLNEMLDDTVDLTYLIEQTLEPEEDLKTVLAKNHINAELLKGMQPICPIC